MSPVTARRGGLWGFAHPRRSSPPTWPGGLLLLSSLPREGRQVSGCAGGFVLRREQRQDRSGSASFHVGRGQRLNVVEIAGGIGRPDRRSRRRGQQRAGQHHAKHAAAESSSV